MKKQLIAALMCLCVMMSALPMVAFAEGDSGTPLVPSTLVPSTQAGSALCEHHPQHNGSCGYTEGTAEIPCAHEHDGDCYTLVTECVHEHTAECYPAESVSENTATPSEPEEAEPTACTHVCTEESGCITEVLNCKHEHKVNGGEADREGGLGRDEACGYVSATEGTPCTFVCEICNAQDSGDPATPSDAQPEECTCETLCTEEEINGDCPVCSAEGAELDKVCVGAALLLTAPTLRTGEIELYVGGQQIKESGCYENQNGTWKKVDGTEPANGQFSYDADTFTLTLNQAMIVNYQDVTVGGGFTYPGSVIAFSQSADVSLTIEVSQGTSNITGTGGIRVVSKAGDASLSISGPGSLEVKNVSNDSGIVLIGSKNVNLGINSADVTISNVQYYGVQLAAGDACKSTATINDGNLTVSDSVVGIYFMRLYTSGPSSLTVSGNAMVDTEGKTGGIINGFPDSFQIGADGESGGIVFNGNSGTVYGNVTLQEDLEIGTDETLTIGKDASLTVPDGKTLTNNGTINVESGGKLEGTTTGNGTLKIAPTITTQPQDVEVKENETATFNVKVTGTEPLSYQWQQSTDNGQSWTDITGETNATYTIATTTMDMSGTQYRCVVKNSIDEVTSDAATLTVSPKQYAVTVQTDGNGTASASTTAATAGTEITLTATPDSGYHFERWEVVSGTITIQNDKFIMPAENVTVKAVFDRNSSSVGSGGSSYRERGYDFWMDVRDEIRHADPGDTVKANARTYDRMPWSVMEALRSADGVTLHITWNGGEDIIIPSEAALSEQSRVYYPLSYLEDMTFEEESEAPAADPDKVNPETGGILEVTAPAVTIPAGEPEVTAPQRGLAETPELAEEGIEQPLPGIYEPEETVTTSTTEESGTSGLWIAGVVAVLAAAAGGGVWFWKRRSNS